MDREQIIEHAAKTLWNRDKATGEGPWPPRHPRWLQESLETAAWWYDAMAPLIQQDEDAIRADERRKVMEEIRRERWLIGNQTDLILGVNPATRLTLIRQRIAATVPGAEGPTRGRASATGAPERPDAYPSEGGQVAEAPGASEAVGGPACTTGQGMTITGSLPGRDNWELFIPAPGSETP